MVLISSCTEKVQIIFATALANSERAWVHGNGCPNIYVSIKVKENTREKNKSEELGVWRT